MYGHADLEGDSDSRVVVRTDGSVSTRMGDTVYLKVQEGQIHAFHANDVGLRLN